MKKTNLISTAYEAGSQARKAKRSDRIATAAIHGIALCILLLLAGFTGYVLWQGLAAASPAIFSFTPAGIGNQLFNTLYLVFLSLLVSVPAGVGAGIYLAEYAKPGKMTEWIRIAIETLSSLPSIVAGLFGYLAFIILTGARWNLFAGAMTVSILSVPLITSTTYDAFKALPPGYKTGSLALGATHFETIRDVLLPAAFMPILTGVILAAGRGFGEAAALLCTAGMSTDINWSVWNIASPVCPLNPFRPGETLSLAIWASRTEAVSADASGTAAAASAILMLLVLSFSIGARVLGYRISRKTEGEQE